MAMKMPLFADLVLNRTSRMNRPDGRPARGRSSSPLVAFKNPSTQVVSILFFTVDQPFQ
jgi:hypothetical protein